MDILFLKETIINFIILYLTSKLSLQSTTLKRMFMASIIASIFTISALFFSIEITNVFKLICATVIVTIAFKFNSIYSYMSVIVMFYIVTFLVGGIFLYANMNDISNYAFTFLISFLLLLVIKEYKKKYQIQSYIAELEIFEGNKFLKALIDTGHSLTTCYDEPVIVLSNKCKEQMKYIERKNEKDRTVCYKTIQQESVIVKGKKYENIKIRYKKEEYKNEAVIIFSDVSFDGYDAIIGLNFFEHAIKSSVTKENKKKKENKYGDIIFN
ncbi:MAG: sigma-E processing peptidase SpoIIGA [Clostridia bacterium]|nr:sigma-E processing peptidase SpoIIGA [Clostridia bacterium]